MPKMIVMHAATMRMIKVRSCAQPGGERKVQGDTGRSGHSAASATLSGKERRGRRFARLKKRRHAPGPFRRHGAAGVRSRARGREPMPARDRREQAGAAGARGAAEGGGGGAGKERFATAIEASSAVCSDVAAAAPWEAAGRGDRLPAPPPWPAVTRGPRIASARRPPAGFSCSDAAVGAVPAGRVPGIGPASAPRARKIGTPPAARGTRAASPATPDSEARGRLGVRGPTAARARAERHCISDLAGLGVVGWHAPPPPQPWPACSARSPRPGRSQRSRGSPIGRR